MSSGSELIEEALQEIGVSSPFTPTNPESIQKCFVRLNGMLERWRDIGINMGTVPIADPGEELSEPLGARDGIVANLALEVKGLFPNAVLQPETRALANKGLAHIRKVWEEIEIPAPVARPTYPKGQGTGGDVNRNFYLTGERVEDEHDA